MNELFIHKRADKVLMLIRPFCLIMTPDLVAAPVRFVDLVHVLLGKDHVV